MVRNTHSVRPRPNRISPAAPASCNPVNIVITVLRQTKYVRTRQDKAGKNNNNTDLSKVPVGISVGIAVGDKNPSPIKCPLSWFVVLFLFHEQEKINSRAIDEKSGRAVLPVGSRSNRCNLLEYGQEKYRLGNL